MTWFYLSQQKKYTQNSPEVQLERSSGISFVRISSTFQHWKPKCQVRHQSFCHVAPFESQWVYSLCWVRKFDEDFETLWTQITFDTTKNDTNNLLSMGKENRTYSWVFYTSDEKLHQSLCCTGNSMKTLMVHTQINKYCTRTFITL